MRDICAKIGIPNLPQCPDVRKNPYGETSNFQISGKYLLKKVVITSWISTRPGLVTKLDKKNKIISKKMNDDVMS